MENILLSNGQNVIVGSEMDCIEVVGENLGYELADTIRRIVGDKLEKYEDIANHESYEKCGMEKDLEECNRLMRDVGEEIDDLREYLTDVKRIDKGKIAERLATLSGRIYSEL